MSPVARVTEHLTIVFSDVTRVQQLPAGGAAEAELVIHLAQTLHLLSKVDILITPGTHSGHDHWSVMWSGKVENILQSLQVNKTQQGSKHNKQW